MGRGRPATLTVEMLLSRMKSCSGEWIAMGDIARPFGNTRETVARYLKIAVDAGYVESRKKGSTTEYRLLPKDEEQGPSEEEAKLPRWL